MLPDLSLVTQIQPSSKLRGCNLEKHWDPSPLCLCLKTPLMAESNSPLLPKASQMFPSLHPVRTYIVLPGSLLVPVTPQGQGSCLPVWPHPPPLTRENLVLPLSPVSWPLFMGPSAESAPPGVPKYGIWIAGGNLALFFSHCPGPDQWGISPIPMCSLGIMTLIELSLTPFPSRPVRSVLTPMLWELHLVPAKMHLSRTIEGSGQPWSPTSGSCWLSSCQGKSCRCLCGPLLRCPEHRQRTTSLLLSIYVIPLYKVATSTSNLSKPSFFFIQ